MGCRRTPASLWCAAKFPPASERRGSSHGIPRRRPLTRKTLRHHDGDAEGARSQSQGAGRHFAVGRRAGFRHAGQHQARGDRGDQARRDQISAGARHSALARGDRGKIQAGERARLQAVRHDRRHRRQANSLQRLPRHDEQGRRGHHPRALLGELSRDGRDQLGRAGHRADETRTGLQAQAGRPRTRDHAAHQVGHPQLAVEPERRGLYARRAQGPDRRLDAPPACVGADRRHVRASRLRRLRVHDARADRAGP